MTQTAVATAGQAELKSFGTPDEVRSFPNGRLELITVGGATIGRAVFEAWLAVGDNRCSRSPKRSSCEAPHFHYHVAGMVLL